MARAAYCAMCGGNVYLNDDGVCPQGHPADQLTNHYEAPDLTPAERAAHDAVAPAEKRELNRSLIIVLLIAAFLVLCGVGACVAGLVAFAPVRSAITQVTGADKIPIGEVPLEGEPGAGENSSASFDPEAYFGNLTARYFPGFSYVSYYTIGDTSAEPAKYQVLAESDTAPGFRMIFSLLRWAQGAPDGIGEMWLYGGEDGATWQRLPDHGDETSTSLSNFAGPGASVKKSVAEQIMTDFVAAHPNKIVSDFETDGGTYTLRGFDESDLDDWMGDTTSFESIWEPNPVVAGEWVETSF